MKVAYRFPEGIVAVIYGEMVRETKDGDKIPHAEFAVTTGLRELVVGDDRRTGYELVEDCNANPLRLESYWPSSRCAIMIDYDNIDQTNPDESKNGTISFTEAGLEWLETLPCRIQTYMEDKDNLFVLFVGPKAWTLEREDMWRSKRFVGGCAAVYNFS